MCPLSQTGLPKGVKLYELYGLSQSMKQEGAEEARKRFPELLDRAQRDGIVTIVTKRGVPCAAIVPLSHLKRAETPKLQALRGSAGGCYGDVAEYIDESRRGW